MVGPRAGWRYGLSDDLVRYERALRVQGFSRVAGADEAGRGALAGPLVAAAVVLPDAFDPEGIDDSKVLTRNQRESAYQRIVAVAAYAVAKAEPGVIDSRGLHRSNLALLRRCVRALDPPPEYALTDGFPVPRMPCPSLAMKKGDAVAVSVAAASIVAKVTRDRVHGPHASPISGVRFRPQLRLRNARTPGGARPARPDADPPTLLRVCRPAAAAGDQPVGRRGGVGAPRASEHGPMNEDDIERFEEERELELYRSTGTCSRCSRS